MGYEKNLIINNRELKYRGIFRYDELFSVINQALEERGYQKREKKSEELVTEKGKKIYLELRPFKTKSSYITLMIKIKIALNYLTETTEKLEGRKRSFQQGDVLITFDAWTMTDYEQRWGMKPWVYFMKGMIHKFLYKFPLESGFTGELVGDTAYIYAKIKKLLNSYRPSAERQPTEEEIRKQMEEEIKRESKEE